MIGDVSGNGIISAYDASLILQYVVGLIDVLPADSIGSPSTISPRSYVVSIPEQSAKAGDRIHVPIAINDLPVASLSAVPSTAQAGATQTGATGLLAGGITMKYNPTVLKAIDVAALGMLSGSYWKANTLLDGEVRFAFATTENVKGGGNFLMVEFEVLPNTEGKISSLILDNVNLSNSLTISKINGSITVIPSKFVLLQNYPNPFNPETWIPFKLATDAFVTISIYNQKGQLIRTLNLGNKDAGIYITKDKAAHWDGKDSLGERVSSGLYFYQLQAGEFGAIRKMVIMK